MALLFYCIFEETLESKLIWKAFYTEPISRNYCDISNYAKGVKYKLFHECMNIKMVQLHNCLVNNVCVPSRQVHFIFDCN